VVGDGRPPQNVHRKQTESFLILSGRMGIEADGVVYETGAGESRSVPPGTAHTFWNAGDEPCVHDVKLEPALDMDHFFEGVVTLEEQHRLPPHGRPDLLRIALLFGKHDNLFAGVPRGVQRAVYALARSIAWATGGVAAIAVPIAAPRVTSHAAIPSSLGVARSMAALEAVVDIPGPIVVETVIGGDCEVPRSGLINLKDAKARKAKLVDGPEPIVIALHAIHHPTAGLCLIDTGVERALRDDPKHAALSGVVASVMGADKIRVRTDTASFIASQKEPVRGVFLTHLHPDHISGMRDLPNEALIYTGPGESAERHLTNFLVRSVTDVALEGAGCSTALSTSSATARSGRSPSQDTLTAAPRISRGRPTDPCCSPATLPTRSRDGITTWSRERSRDLVRGHASLEKLRALVARHPQIEVRVGHQIRATKTMLVEAGPALP
jgi:N-acyl homoserine lactone hydrolase